MQQYYEIKEKYPDAILFFRMWDFYEMFEQDAQIAHKILWITLTSRNKNAENPILLAGIPYHAKEKYLPLLIDAGYKVAIAEQVSDPKLKGIVQREVVRVVTPATLWLEGEGYDQQQKAAILVSLVTDSKTYALSIMNLSNHHFYCSEFETFESCATELYKIAPSEVILQKNLLWDRKIHEILSKKYGLNIYYYDFRQDAYQFLCSQFWVKNLQWYGIEQKSFAQKASAQLLSYVGENQKADFSFLQDLRYESFHWFLELDEATIRSLDLVYNIATKSQREGTLVWALDETKTSMGKRYLREQLLHPLQDISHIQDRQNFIQALKSDTHLLEKIRKQLNFIADIDAILTRLSLSRATPRDLLALKRSLVAVREVLSLIENLQNTQLKKILEL